MKRKLKNGRKAVEAMNDLISRETVIEVLKETGIIQDNDLGHLVVEEINRIPTAYDPDKVVEDLEDAQNRAVANYHSTIGDLVAISYGEMTAYQIAIEIVKKGGADAKQCEVRRRHVETI